MYTPVYDAVEALADRPPIHHSTPWSTGSFGDVVREDLDNLAALTVKAVRHCEELSRSAPALRSLDMQRDVLHLQARVGGLARQIADAKETLERLQKRTGADPSFRQLDLPLS